MHPGHPFSELAQRAQDQQTAMLWEVLKYAANSPEVPLCDFHIFGLSKKEARTFMSRAGGRGTVDQAAARRILGQMGYSDMRINGTPV